MHAWIAALAKAAAAARPNSRRVPALGPSGGTSAEASEALRLGHGTNQSPHRYGRRLTRRRREPAR